MVPDILLQPDLGSNAAGTGLQDLVGLWTRGALAAAARLPRVDSGDGDYGAAVAGDPDVFVAQAPYDRPVLQNHTWSGTRVGSDLLTIPLSDRLTDPPVSSFFIGVTGYGGPASFTIEASVGEGVAAAGDPEGSGVVLSEQQAVWCGGMWEDDP